MAEYDKSAFMKWVEETQFRSGGFDGKSAGEYEKKFLEEYLKTLEKPENNQKKNSGLIGNINKELKKINDYMINKVLKPLWKEVTDMPKFVKEDFKKEFGKDGAEYRKKREEEWAKKRADKARTEAKKDEMRRRIVYLRRENAAKVYPVTLEKNNIKVNAKGKDATAYVKETNALKKYYMDIGKPEIDTLGAIAKNKPENQGKTRGERIINKKYDYDCKQLSNQVTKDLEAKVKQGRDLGKDGEKIGEIYQSDPKVATEIASKFKDNDEFMTNFYNESGQTKEGWKHTFNQIKSGYKEGWHMAKDTFKKDYAEAKKQIGGSEIFKQMDDAVRKNRAFSFTVGLAATAGGIATGQAPIAAAGVTMAVWALKKRQDKQTAAGKSGQNNQAAKGMVVSKAAKMAKMQAER